MTYSKSSKRQKRNNGVSKSRRADWRRRRRRRLGDDDDAHGNDGSNVCVQLWKLCPCGEPSGKFSYGNEKEESSVRESVGCRRR